jgi:F0F1-type ATP synthase membrane subunit b/b'
VDAHLRALVVEFEQLQRAAAGGAANASLASAAGTHVQSIIEAAETAAADIQRNAEQEARQVREAASTDAERTREAALEKARTQVAAVAKVSASLLERVGSMDAEVSALIASLRTGTGKLAADLAAVEAGMGELYGAASGGTQTPASPPARSPAPSPQQPEPSEAVLSPTAAPSNGARDDAPADEGDEASGGDLDGARLIALNMALNGESRADTERYLAENFQIPDRLKLIDEVYAAIEG